MLKVLDDLYATDGYMGFVAHETLNVLDFVADFVRRYGASPPAATQICNFINAHLSAVCAVHNTRSLGDADVRSWVDSFRKLPCGGANPLDSDKWIDLPTLEDDPALAKHGYVTVEVYHRPKIGKTNRPFLFARGTDGLEYYVNRRYTGLSEEQFDDILEGDRLAVHPSEEFEAGKAIPVRDAVVL